MANVKLGAKAVGSIVKLKVNGTVKEFIVVHQGKPSSIYDESCNGTWLLMKDIYENRQWDSSNVNKYESSDIHTYLNNTFLNLFESNIRDVIKQVKIPYRKNGGSGGQNQSGANGLSCKVFLLSGPEVGLAGASYMPNDGAKLDYFNANIETDSKRIAHLNGSAAFWWLRSPHTNYSSDVGDVLSDGSLFFHSAYNSYGIRPALILPPDMEVDSSGNVTPPPPATHKALINGTIYEVTGGKCLVNGTVYNILKGRTLIAGTGYDITLIGLGCKVNITGQGSTKEGCTSYVEVGGRKIVAPEVLVLPKGTEIVARGWYNFGEGGVYLNGSPVVQVSGAISSYVYTVEADVSVDLSHYPTYPNHGKVSIVE